MCYMGTSDLYVPHGTRGTGDLYIPHVLHLQFKSYSIGELFGFPVCRMQSVVIGC